MRIRDWSSDVCSSDRTPGDYGPVQVGDTLGKIARSIDRDGHSLDQVMLALLRANPYAFIKGNINLVKAGAVLRIPDGSELSEYSARAARAIVHEQIGQRREMRKRSEEHTYELQSLMRTSYPV